MRIPTEDVEKVRDYLDKNARSSPELYGISADLEEGSPELEQQIQKLKDRVQPVVNDITNEQIRLMTKEVFQRKMEECGQTINPTRAAVLKLSRDQIQPDPESLFRRNQR